MLEHEAGNLYREVCKRYNTKPTWDGHCEWRDCLKGIEYDEGGTQRRSLRPDDLQARNECQTNEDELSLFL